MIILFVIITTNTTFLIKSQKITNDHIVYDKNIKQYKHVIKNDLIEKTHNKHKTSQTTMHNEPSHITKVNQVQVFGLNGITRANDVSQWSQCPDEPDDCLLLRSFLVTLLQYYFEMGPPFLFRRRDGLSLIHIFL